MLDDSDDGDDIHEENGMEVVELSPGSSDDNAGDDDDDDDDDPGELDDLLFELV